MFEEFHKHFKPLELAFNKTLSDIQVDFWHEEVREKDLTTFIETCKRLRYGDKFPNPKMFMETYRGVEQTLGRNSATPDEVPSCNWCEHGKIFMDDEKSQSFIFKCGECLPWQVKNLQPITIAQVQKRMLNGWALSWGLQRKWDAIEAGTYNPEDDKPIKVNTDAVLSKMGYGKEPDKAKEEKRHRSKAAVEQDAIPF